MTTPIATLATEENVATLLEDWPELETSDESLIPVVALNPELYQRRWSLYVEAVIRDMYEAGQFRQSVLD